MKTSCQFVWRSCFMSGLHKAPTTINILGSPASVQPATFDDDDEDDSMHDNSFKQVVARVHQSAAAASMRAHLASACGSRLPPSALTYSEPGSLSCMAVASPLTAASSARPCACDEDSCTPSQTGRPGKLKGRCSGVGPLCKAAAHRCSTCWVGQHMAGNDCAHDACAHHSAADQGKVWPCNTALPARGSVALLAPGLGAQQLVCPLPHLAGVFRGSCRGCGKEPEQSCRS